MIVPYKGPTKVCSPWFHVSKLSNKTDPRLIVDYSPVHKVIDVPKHPGTCPEHEWRRVTKGAKYFLGLDLYNAYG
jgi:hypothetical protein